MKSAFILSISFSVIIFTFSLIFKVAGKLRLTLPLIYFLAATISTFYTDWTTKNESKVLLGLYILIGLVALSWMYSLIKKIKSKRSNRFEDDFKSWQIQRARELGVPLNSITFDEKNNLIDPRTGKPVNFNSDI